MKKIIDGIIFHCNENIPEEEVKAYIQRGHDKLGESLRTITAKVDGEYIELTYSTKAPNFDRIRRITGYLVGTLDRFNDGKRAEEKDRVKHGV